MDFLQEYGVALGGAFITIVTLGTVVRTLWAQAKEEQAAHLQALSEQFAQRLADKNSELTQVWAELRSAREEVRIIRAEKEWLERMNDRGDDMLKTALEELRARSSRPR